MPQHASASGRNCLTCWGPPSGVRELQRVLEGRRESAPEGSYTKRLFDDPTFLRNKLVEEAQVHHIVLYCIVTGTVIVLYRNCTYIFLYGIVLNM